MPVSGESIVAADRKARVTLDPGDDTEVAAYAGARRWGADASYRLGLERHFADRYDGSLDGDYASLAEASDTSELYHRVTIGYDTVAAYKRRAFPLPLMASLAMNGSLAGRNGSKSTYFELSLTGFFDVR